MPVSEDDVNWAYTLVFGRLPESDSVRAHWVSSAENVRHLLDCLRISPEADRKNKIFRGQLIYDLCPELQRRILPILRKLAPYKTLGLEKIRVGQDYDGGYVIGNDLSASKIAYSLGIKDDASFDLDLASCGIEVYQYDHTIERAPLEHPLLKWSKIGIEGRESNNDMLDTLLNIITNNGHHDRNDMILKCDIEGHEWEMLGGLNLNILRSFRQIIIELHLIDRMMTENFADILRRAVFLLTECHRVIHVHANNCAPLYVVGGIPLPSVFELTLLRNDVCEMELSNDIFPTKLDMPNAPHLADYQLGTFRF